MVSMGEHDRTICHLFDGTALLTFHTTLLQLQLNLPWWEYMAYNSSLVFVSGMNTWLTTQLQRQHMKVVCTRIVLRFDTLVTMGTSIY